MTALTADAFVGGSHVRAARTVTHTAPRTRLRMTARGRRVLTAAVALPVAGALAWGIIGSGTAAAVFGADAPMPAESVTSETALVLTSGFDTITIAAGDSLWTIAERVAPGSDPRDVVDALSRLNALESSALAVGDRLAIPTEYTR